MMAFVTIHAAERYVQRVAPHLTTEQARREIMLSASAIDKAAAFGAGVIRLGNGARLVLDGDTITTVKTPNARHPVSRAMLKRYHRARR